MATTMSSSNSSSQGMSSNGAGKKSKHLPILKWLQAIELTEYSTLFYQYGGVEDILHFTEASLKQLGVRSSAHRAKMASSLIVLRQKFHNRWKAPPPPSSSSSSSRVAGLSPPGSGRSSPYHSNQADYASYEVVSPSPTSRNQPQLSYPTPSSSHYNPTPQSVRELLKYRWYHGNIARGAAGALLTENGDFLIRDSVSEPGEYVLTCRHKANIVNFKINSQVVTLGGGSSSRKTYQFEEETFDRVPELIQFHVETQKPITELSGTVIMRPVGRTENLDYGELKVSQLSPVYSVRSRSASPVGQSIGGGGAHSGAGGGSSDVKNGSIYNKSESKSKVSNTNSSGVSQSGLSHSSVHSNTAIAGKHTTTTTSTYSSVPNSPAHSPKPSPLLRRKPAASKTGSQPLLSDPDPVAGGDAMDRSGSLPFIGKQSKDDGIKHNNTSAALHPPPRRDSDPLLLECTLERQKRRGVVATESGRINTSDGDLSKPAPPKPLRTPSLNVAHKPVVSIRNKALYEDDDRDYSDYDQVKAWPAALKREEEENSSNNKDNKDSNIDEEQWSQLDQDIPPPQDDYDEINDDDVLLARKERLDIDEDYTEISDSDDTEEVGPRLPAKNNHHEQQRDHSPLTTHIYDSPTSSPKSVLRRDNQSHNNQRQSQQTKRKSSLIRNMPKRTLKLPPDQTTAFDLSSYSSRILTPDNSILEASSLSSVKSLLLAVMPSTLAQHITGLDLALLKVTGIHDLGLGVQSGLELLLLPQGETLRKDIMERCLCLRLFVCTSIVTCAEATERARMVEQWIQVAAHLHAALGNLMAFSCVMHALNMPQVRRLSTTWSLLQRSHFQTHQMYEFKLRGLYRTLEQGTGTAGSSSSSSAGAAVTVPYILPVLKLYHYDDMLLKEDGENSDGLWGEDNDDGDMKEGGDNVLWDRLDSVSRQLASARDVARQYGSYRAAAENVMRDHRENEDIMDMMRTELHLRLMFGMKLTGRVIAQQYNKYRQVLQAFSLKMEPSPPPSPKTLEEAVTDPHRETAL